MMDSRHDGGRRVLVVEDEPAIADTIVFALRTEGFAPHWVSTGREALAAVERDAPALVILDVGLPDTTGFELCREIQRVTRAPVIFVTARGSEIDRVVGLELGADDYVVKPFSPRELVARVRARLRRVGAVADAPPAAASAGFIIDDEGLRIRANGVDLGLTRYEFRLFAALLRRPGRVYSREQLLALAWDQPEEALDRTVDTHIKTLRQKIRERAGAPDPIRTHRGLGYSCERS